MFAQTAEANTAGVRLPALATGAAVATIAGVFLVPLLFPPSHPSISAAYTAGFNNRIASLFAAAISLALFAVFWRYRLNIGAEAYASERLPVRWFLVSAAVCAAFTLILGALACEARVAYNDIRYFIDPMDLVTAYHKRIYKDFAFLYGPLLLYFPIAVHALLRPLHVSVAASYFVALAIGQVIGLFMLFWIVNALPARRDLKTAVYIVFSIQTLSPLLGLNYSFIRGAIPFAALALLARIRGPWIAAALAAACEMLALGVSPEMGIAFAGGAAAYAAVRAYRAGLIWLATGVAPAAGAALFLIWAGRAYLDSLALFSRGALNLIVEPLPHILVYLAALVWLAPAAVAWQLRGNRPEAPMLAGFYAAALGLISPAFGRCDPLHVMFNGLGIYLLAMVAVSTLRRRPRVIWVTCMSAVLIWSQLVNYLWYRRELAPVFHWAFFHSPQFVQNATVKIAGRLPHNEESPELRPQFALDVRRLESYVGAAQVATPVILPFGIEEDLKSSGHFQPDYDIYLMSVCDAESERAKAERMDRSEWALVPSWDYVLIETPENSKPILGFGFNYPHRRTPFPSGALIRKELADNWTKVAGFGPFDLYRHVRAR